MNLRVRAATLRDLQEVTALFRREAEYQQSLSDSFDLEPDADWSSYAAGRIQRPNGTVLVAEDATESKDNSQPKATLAGFIDIRVIQRGQSAPPSARRWPLSFRKAQRTAAGPVVGQRLAGLIDDIFVEPEFRRRGVATQLMQAAMEWFAQRHVRQVEAAIWARNEASQQFFSGHGFERARILMKKNL